MNKLTRLQATIMGLEPRIVILVAGALGVLIVLAILAIVFRRRSAKYGGRPDLDSHAAILEEVRLRLENLPSLPQMARLDKVDLSLDKQLDEPAAKSENDVAADAKPLPMRLSAPPLPTDTNDPITGEPDEEAYRQWLKEWLLYAEQYGDETPADLSGTDMVDEQAFQ